MAEDVQACGILRAKIHPGSRLSEAYKLPPLHRPQPISHGVVIVDVAEKRVESHSPGGLDLVRAGRL